MGNDKEDSVVEFEHILKEERKRRKKALKYRKQTGFCCLDLTSRPWNPVLFLRDWKLNIKCAYQRVRYGYCDRDVWDITNWFLKVMPGAMKDFRDHFYFYPAEICEEAGNDPSFSDSDDAATEEAARRWTAVLDEMISLFEEADEFWSGYRRNAEQAMACYRKGMELLTRWFWDLWW